MGKKPSKLYILIFLFIVSLGLVLFLIQYKSSYDPLPEGLRNPSNGIRTIAEQKTDLLKVG